MNDLKKAAEKLRIRDLTADNDELFKDRVGVLY